MPRAGFYAVESGKISFRKDGNWYSDDERIANGRIALLFSKSIQRGPDGLYYLKIGDERAPIIVEDTPYVVTTIEEDGAGGFTIVLNDGEREPLDPATLEIGAENVLYTRVKGGKFSARFLRPAYYHLSPRFETDPEGRRFHVNIGGRRYPLTRTVGEQARSTS